MLRDNDPDLDEEEEDIFAIERLEWQLAKPYGKIVALAAGSNTLLMGTDAGFVVRFTVVDDRKQHIELPMRGRETIYKVFLDPTANHALVSTMEGNTYYLAEGSTKVVAVKGVRGNVIESVAWNRSMVRTTQGKRRESGANGTGAVLVGTKAGAILELVIEDGKEKSSKKLWAIDDIPMAICGLATDLFPDDSKKFFVMAATPTRLYQFVGGPTFELMFSKYIGQKNRGFQEFPENSGHTELHFQYEDYPIGIAERCAWLTQAGIFQGELKFGKQKSGGKVCNEHTLINYPEPVKSSIQDRKGSYQKRLGQNFGRGVPRSIAMSRFHYLMLLDGRFVCTNRLSRAVVYDISLKDDAATYGQFRGLAADLTQSTYWMFSDRCVFEILIQDEERDVWRLLLSESDFEGALRHCGEDRRRRDIIHSAQADYLFNKGKFDMAAKAYARTKRTFEEIALKFVTARKSKALKTYLLAVLAALPAVAETQLTMLGTWVTELFLDELRTLDGPAVDGDTKDDRKTERENVANDFRRFLEDHYDILDQATTSALITSHGRPEELVHFANIIGDRDWLIRHYLSRGKARRALLILAKYWTRHSSGKRKKATFDSELFYHYTPKLLTHSPQIAEQLVTTLTGMDRTVLDPTRLIPAFIRYDTVRKGKEATFTGAVGTKRGSASTKLDVHQGVRYFTWAVETAEADVTVHNYLMSLLVKQENSDALIRYIQRFGHSGKTAFDFKMALALCYQHYQIRACSELHRVVGDYEEAINVALKISTQSAQLIAVEAEKAVPAERSKRLWLLVARHVIKRERDVAKATKKVSEILKHCSLRIEQVLPYFPDFVKIGSLKQEVVRSLEDYNASIKDLDEKMKGHTTTYKQIQRDITELKNRHDFIPETKRCDLSSKPIGSQPFVYFPCGHVFLLSALTENMIEFAKMKPMELLKGTFKAFTSKEEKIRQELKKIAEQVKKTSGQVNLSLIDLTRSDWSRLACHECPLCGSMLIVNCHDPLVLPTETEEANSWSIFNT